MSLVKIKSIYLYIKLFSNKKQSSAINNPRVYFGSLKLVGDNFASDADAELEVVLVVVKSDFDVEGDEWVLVGDRHVEQVSCRFTFIQWAACSSDPVTANLTIFGKLVDDG